MLVENLKNRDDIHMKGKPKFRVPRAREHGPGSSAGGASAS